MDVEYKGKAALMIVNWEYEGFENLVFPESDGEMMQDMLIKSEFDLNRVKVVKNCQNVLNEIDQFIEENDDQALEAFHFHYSGRDITTWSSDNILCIRTWSKQCQY